ncbi:Ldh family oxidoreductase [Salinicoccus kekensis]|uniref:Ureidoglycolate dehydrogenase (NAD+) n=1 Tax=Salinicoccus kekensis TaxID=714307 RepID=A0A285UAN1_9STAP|nr:Ldh family oxidoreductase [Salinicoccus kekensis]SOC37616.1 ureidoglycolate dehydrogenase (NAD+) [Salinicoccus kekensis]
MKAVDIPTARDRATEKLISRGLERRPAGIVADVLLHADQRGVSSHGLMRLEHYLKRIEHGGLNVRPDINIEMTSGSSFVCDGDDGLGHYIVHEAVEYAIDKVKDQGIVMGLIKNSSHCGALSYYVKEIAEHGYIGLMFSQTDTIAVPFKGTAPYFGSNPIAFGFPKGEGEYPTIIDIATTEVALGKVLHAQGSGAQIPYGWGTNVNGEETNNPDDIKYLKHFGGPKGYALAFAIDVLTGILGNESYGTNIPPMYEELHKYRNLSQSIILINPKMFGDNLMFESMLKQMEAELKDIPTTDGSFVKIPGEIEMEKALESDEVIINEDTYQILFEEEER